MITNMIRITVSITITSPILTMVTITTTFMIIVTMKIILSLIGHCRYNTVALE